MSIASWIREKAALFEGCSCFKQECLIGDYYRNKHGRTLISVYGQPWDAMVYMCTLVHGDKPTPLHEVAHSCGCGHLGCIEPSHLRWATRKENSADARAHGTVAEGSKNGQSILKEDQVVVIKKLLLEGVKHKDIAARYNVRRQTITAINQDRVWKSVRGHNLDRSEA